MTTWRGIKDDLVSASGFDGWRFHDFRRSFATALGEAQVAEPVVDAVLNHRQAATRGGVLGALPTRCPVAGTARGDGAVGRGARGGARRRRWPRRAERDRPARRTRARAMTARRRPPTLSVVGRSDVVRGRDADDYHRGLLLGGVGPVSKAEAERVLADVAGLATAIRHFAKTYTPRLAHRVLSQEIAALERQLKRGPHRPAKAGLPDPFLAMYVQSLELGLPSMADREMARAIEAHHKGEFSSTTDGLAKRIGKLRKQAAGPGGWGALTLRAMLARMARDCAQDWPEHAEALESLAGLPHAPNPGDEWGRCNAELRVAFLSAYVRRCKTPRTGNQPSRSFLPLPQHRRVWHRMRGLGACKHRADRIWKALP